MDRDRWCTLIWYCLNLLESSPVGKLSDDEVSWLASISYIGAFLGTLVFMKIILTCGRKNSFLIMAVPNFVCEVFFRY